MARFTLNLLLTAASLSTVTIAIPCDFKTLPLTSTTHNNDNVGNLVFQNEDEIRTKLDGCTTLVNDIAILANFSGTKLDFTGLKAMSRVSIRTTAIMEILIPDLEKVGGFEYANGATIETFSAPKLANITGSLSLENPVTNLSLPALVEAYTFWLPRGVKTLSAPKLRHVKVLRVNNLVKANNPSPQALNFSLPSLETAADVEISGLFTDIHLPKLEIVSVESQPFRGPLSIAVEPPQTINLPSLRSVGDLEFPSLNANISLPVLNDTYSIRITGTNHPNITFPALTWSADVKVTGNITDISFPAMTNAWKMDISATEFTCGNETAKSDWARMNATWDGTEPCPNPKRYGRKNRKTCGKTDRYYTCKSYPGWTPPRPRETSTSTNGLQSSAPRMLEKIDKGGIGILFVLVIGVGMLSL